MLRPSASFLLALLFSSLTAGAQSTPAQRLSNAKRKPSALPGSMATAPAPPAPGENKPRRFFDRTNLALFTGVAAARVLDFTSTEHFRERGHNEVLLTNSIVDNKPLFAGIEAVGFAVSVAVAYWLYRKGHYKLERWVSIAHIAAAGAGDARNYTLGSSTAAGGP